MHERLILPPDYPDISGPVIFLAGPIQGASNWQKEAIGYIHSKNPKIWVASPRRDIKLLKSDLYNEQVDWETHFLRRAAKDGVVMFWLAKEVNHSCNRPYGQTSRFELAEWKVRHERDGTKLVVGIESGFTNERYIKRRLSQDCPYILIFNSLESACDEAIKKSSANI